MIVAVVPPRGVGFGKPCAGMLRNEVGATGLVFLDSVVPSSVISLHCYPLLHNRLRLTGLKAQHWLPHSLRGWGIWEQLSCVLWLHSRCGLGLHASPSLMGVALLPSSLTGLLAGSYPCRLMRRRALLPCWVLARETLNSLPYGLLYRAANSMEACFSRAHKWEE